MATPHLEQGVKKALLLHVRMYIKSKRCSIHGGFQVFFGGNAHEYCVFLLNNGLLPAHSAVLQQHILQYYLEMIG
jgi:hypothetical protein